MWISPAPGGSFHLLNLVPWVQMTWALQSSCELGLRSEGEERAVRDPRFGNVGEESGGVQAGGMVTR